MNYIIYWLINEINTKTYVGFSEDIRRRIKEHKECKIKTTKDFGKFRCFIIETVDNQILARQREKYWKSAAGRIKLKKYFDKLI